MKGSQQPLISRTSQTRLGLVIDVENRSAYNRTLNETIHLQQNPVGHFMLRLLSPNPVVNSNPDRADLDDGAELG